MPVLEAQLFFEAVLTHDAADDRGLLGNENVLTVALVQYTWWTGYDKMRERYKEHVEQ